MKMKRSFALILAAILVFSLLAGCGSKTDTEKSTLKFQLGSEPSSLDVHQCAEMSAHTIAQSLHAGLMKFDADGNVVGDLAESWEWNDDYTQMTIKLKDAKFSDGSSIKASDVKFSFERGIEYGVSTYYSYIGSIETPDDTTVVLNLSQPYAVMESSLCLSYFAVFSQAAVEGGMDVAKLPNVTSGAYYVDAWNSQSDIVLKANENYWEGVAPIETVDIVIIGDENTALIALETGDIDFMTGITGLSGSSYDHVSELEDAELFPFQSAAYNFLSLNQSVEYFADENVRKAIDCAIDRDTVILTALDGKGSAAGIPIAEGMGGYVDGFEPTAYDLEKAKEYLAASNYPDGFSFEIMASTDEWVKAATVIQENLAKLNITVNVTELELGAAITNLSNGSYEGCIMSWSNPANDISNINSMYILGDALMFSAASDGTIGELLNAACAETGDSRKETLSEAYNLITEQVPYVSLYWTDGYYGISSDLNIANPIGPVGYNFYDMSWK